MQVDFVSNCSWVFTCKQGHGGAQPLKLKPGSCLRILFSTCSGLLFHVFRSTFAFFWFLETTLSSRDSLSLSHSTPNEIQKHHPKKYSERDRRASVVGEVWMVEVK